MNQQLKTILLTILTLSFFTIALVELSGVSKTALFNKYKGEEKHKHTSDIGKKSNLPKTTIAFKNTKHNFGTIQEGEKVTHTYKFKNTGSNPLVISDARASCGCTVPSYPKEPILPGGSGEIVVEFNSKGKPGQQNKSVRIYSNAQEEEMSLAFDVDVTKK